MALAYPATLRNAQLDVITAAVGASGLVRIYNGPRPATGGAATTLLAQLTCSATFAPAAAGGVLTPNAVGNDVSADAGGTAVWFRVTTSAGVHVIDGDCGVSGSDMNLNTTTIVAGGPVSLTSWTITRGNA